MSIFTKSNVSFFVTVFLMRSYTINSIKETGLYVNNREGVGGGVWQGVQREEGV